MILDLPPELISRIFIRLPVKTLYVLKCVNSYFTRFISTQEFITAHLNFTSEDASMSSVNVIIEGITKSYLEQTSIQSLCHGSPVNVLHLDYPEKEPQKIVWPVGSCNGLVVIIVNWKDLFIWNPATTKHKKLPGIAGHENLLDRSMFLLTRPHIFCGFGFDVSNDDYKFVAFFELNSSNYNGKREFSYEVHVYSLKRNIWIRIPDVTVGEFSNAYGMFVSGKLHWCTPTGDIVSFDVEREVFGTLEHPNYAQGCSAILCVISGSISVCCYRNGYTDVWVMKEYGIVASWTKMFTLYRGGEYPSIPKALSIMPNGEILIEDGFCCFYNPKDDSWRSTEVYFHYDPVIYVESLVSPCCY